MAVIKTPDLDFTDPVAYEEYYNKVLNKKEQALKDNNSVALETSVSDKQMSISDFQATQADKLERIHNYALSNETALQKALTFNFSDEQQLATTGGGSLYGFFSQSLKDKVGLKGDAGAAISRLRKDDWSTLSAFGTAGWLEDAPEEIKQDYRDISEAWENTDPEGFLENIQAFTTNAGYAFADPLTAMTMLFAGPTLKMSTEAALAANKGVQKTILNTIGSQAKNPATIKATIAGTSWAGLADLGTQRVNLAADIQKEFDGAQLAGSLAIGAAAGGTLGRYAPDLINLAGKGYNNIFNSKLSDQALLKSVDEEVVAQGISEETGVPTQSEINLEEAEELQLPFNDDVNILIANVAPDEAKAKQQAVFNAKKARESSKEATRQEKEDRLYGGFVSDAQIDEIAEQYDIDRLKLEEVLFDYEANKDLPNIDDMDDALIEEVGEAFYNLNGPKQRTEFAIASFRNYMANRKTKGTPIAADVEEAVVDLIVKTEEASAVAVPDNIVAQATEFSKKIGGGEQTTAEVADILNQVQSGTISADTARAGLLKKTQAFHGKLAFGRPTKVLTKFQESEGAQELALAIRHDADSTYTGGTVNVGMDFNETWKDYAGSLYAPLIEALNPIKQATIGGLRDRYNIELLRAVRGAVSDNPAINKAASGIKNVLKDVVAKREEAGFTDDFSTDPDYFPRSWNRSALEKDFYGTSTFFGSEKRRSAARQQGPNKFARLLVEDGEAADLSEAYDIVENMLAKSTENKGPYGNNTLVSNSFFTQRKFSNIKDDNKYEDFLDNDIENVMFSYITQSANSFAKKKVFGVNNLQEFDEKYITRIEREVKAVGNKFTAADAEDIRNLYRTLTGEERSDYGPTLSFIRDTYTTALRTSALPMATLSSLPELFLLLQKNTPQSAAYGVSQALGQGTQQLITNIRRGLGEKGLSDAEIITEMREAFMFLENSNVSAADRLGDSYVGNKVYKKMSQIFYKGILLDTWTKGVQLAAYNSSKFSIHKNLQAIKDNGNAGDSKRIKNLRSQLAELNVDVDAGIAYLNRNNGEVNKKDPFYKDIKRGASRFVGGVVLDTGPRAAIKPNWMSNPKVAVFGELLGYPAAYTNKPLKEIVKGLANPIDNPYLAAATVATATSVLTTAALSNYARDPKSFEDKTNGEVIADAVIRVGGTGLPADILRNTAKAYEMTKGNEAAAAISLLGPLGSDISRSFYGKTAPIIGSRMPLYGAIKPVLGEEIKNKYDKMWKDIEKRDRKRGIYNKGGEVNVAQTVDEPDQRIDKMTGRPYDSQAGEAFIDEEDRAERKRYAVGSLVKVVSPFVEQMVDTILTASKGVNLKVSKAGATKVAQQMEEDYQHKSPDEPASLDDPDFQYYLHARTASLIQEKHDLSVEDLAADYPNFAGYMKNEEGAAEKYSKQRYTPEEIAEFDTANEIEDMFVQQNAGDLSDVTNRIQYQLDTIGARSINTNWEYKFENYFKSLAANVNEIATSEDAIAMINQFDPEERRLARKIFSKMPNRALPIDEDGKVIPIDYTVPPKERAGNKKAYIAASKEKELQYRAVSSGFFNEFEEAVGMPNETGLHVGTKPQAERMALFRRQGDEDVFDQDSYLTSRQLSNRLKKPPEAGETPPPLAMMRGYIQVKNPLELDDPNFSLYSDAATLFDTKSTMANLNEAVMLQAPKLNAMKWNTAKDRLLEKIQDFEAWEDTMTKSEKDLLVKKMKKADINITFRKMLEDQGFDSVRYLNTADTPSDVETSQAYSYILFKPGQFKTENAVEFDPQDVRHNFKVGGKVLKALKKGAV